MAGRKKRKSNILDELPPDLSLQCLPSALRDKLMPFQRKGVKFALRKNGRCLIGDEMGLGKTLQAIAVAYHYRQEWPVLVVVPSSLRYQWVEELERWVPDLEPTHIHVVSSRDDIRNISTAQVTILGYGLIQRQDQPLVKALHDQNFQVIIVDESHYLKNRKAVRTQGLVPLVKNAKRALLLTGTPALARPAELFPQVDALLPGKFGSWTKFSKRYCNAHQVFYGRFLRWDTNGASNLAELHSNLQPLMIRRLKAQVLTQLPPKRRQRIPFDVPEGEHKKELDKLAAEWRDLIGRGAVPQSHDLQGMADNPSFRIRQLITEWYHTTALAKAGSVQEYIKVLLENESMKFIVFGHHKHMLQAITQTLIHSKVKYIRIDGSVPSAERTHLVQQFQADPSVKVAVLSILAAGTGLTLTAASHVVFAELYWTPGVLEQAEDRAHRIGQHSAVHVHYLVARNTIDDWMWSMLTRKVSVVTSALNGKLAVLQAEECDKDQAEFLSRAAVWLPGEQQEEDDSFFFTQPNTQKDLRSYFKPKSGGGQKPQPSDNKKHNLGAESVSLIQENDDDGTDFRDVQKTHRAARPDVFVIDSDTESTADESEKDSSTAHLWSDGNIERDASSSSDDTIIETNQTIGDSSSHIGQEAETELDIATPKTKRSRSEDTSSVGEKKAEGLSSRRVGNDAEETGWGCPLCTFQNHELLKVCEMCETPRKKEKPKTRSQQRQHDSDCSSPTLGAAKARNMRKSSAVGTPDAKAVENKTVSVAQKESLSSVVQEREKPCIDTPTKPSSSHSIQNTPTNRRRETPMDNPELDKLAAEWRDLIGRGAVPQSHDQQGMPDNPSFRIRQLITEWYHTTALAKAGSVQEYIKVLLENESMKFIVFGHHKHMLQAVTQTLIHSKVKYIRIDGSVPSAERTHLVQQFQADPTVKVAVLSILAAGTGLTLTAASHVVFAELYWTPGVLEQAEDRAHRIGQHSAVHVHYLVARNTIDDWMWSMLTRKVSVVTSTLNGKLAVLQAEECDKDQAEFLSRAAVWLPGEQQEEDDSFFFTQPNTQKDLRSYFKPKSGGGQKPQPSDNKKHNLGAESVSLIQENDDDGTDFRDVQKTHRAARPQVFVIDSDTESTADESEKDSTTAHLWSDRNIEKDASSSSDDTIIETDQTIGDSSSHIGHEAETGSDVATPKTKRSRSEDTSSVGETEAEGLSNDVEETGWGCPLCTFQNHELLKVCEMCETPRKKEKPTTRSQQRQCDIDFSSPTLGVTKVRNMRSRGSSPDTKAVEEKTVSVAQEEGLLSVVQEREKPCVDTPTKSSSSHSIQNTPTNRNRESSFVKKSTDFLGAEKVSKVQNNNTDIVDLTMYSTTEEDDTTCKSDTTTEQTVATPSSKVASHESQKDNIPKKTQSDILFCSTPPTVPDSSLESSIAEDLAVAAEVFKPSPRRGKSTWQCENSSCGYSNADSDAEDCDACFSPRPRKRLKLSSTESPQSSLGGTPTPSLKTAGTKGTPSRDSNSARKLVEARSPSLQKAVSVSSTSKIVHSALSTPGRKDTSTMQGGKPKLQFQMNKSNIPARFEATSTPPSKKSQNLSSPFAGSPASGSVSSSPLQGSDWFDEDDISDDMLLSSEKYVSPRGHLAGSTGIASKSGGSMYDLENFSMNADIGTEEGDVDCGSKDPVVKLEDVPVFEELQFCASMHTDRIYLYDVDDQPLSCNFSVLDVEQRNMDSLPPLLHQPGNWRLVLRMVQEWNRLSEPKKRVVRRSGRMFISPSLLAEELSQSQRRKAACKNQRFMSKEDFMQRAFKVAEREGGTVQLVSRQRRPSSTVTKPGQLKTSSDKPTTASTGNQESSAESGTAAASSSDSGTADSAVEDSRPTGQEGDETRLRGQLQVVDSAGRSLCLWCQKPVTQQQTSLAADTDGASSHVRPSRYCSTECKEEYRIRMKGSHHSRQQLRDTEFGVCQICGTNMRQIFQQVKDLPMSERKVFLKTTPLSSLPAAQLNKIIADPKEGQFWHADHIVPVADGGGLCSLDNFRTLCVACHRKVTTQQNRERRSAQKQERRSQDGYRSIMDFIKR